MSQEQTSWYAIRRDDGKYLVIVKTPLGARVAIWIDNPELATAWPHMTGANLAAGLDLDPALHAERGGWDVVPVLRPQPTTTTDEQTRVVKFSVALPALLICLLFSSLASAQERPFVAKPSIVTLISLRATDASLTWDLAHRYGGHELNPFMPQNPKLIVGLLAAETAGQVWALAKVSAQHPRVARILTWASLGMESWVVWHNAKQYEGHR